MRRLVVFAGLLVSPTALATADVLICGADDPFYVVDVVDKVSATGLFNSVDAVDCRYDTPTATQLENYDVVMIWSDYTFANPGLLGDRLADYVDAGGGVVQAVFSNGFVPIAGRFANGGYEAISGTNYNFGFQLTLQVDDATHPILDGVGSFNGGMQSFHTSDGALTAGAEQQAHWSNGLPLIATLESHQGRVVGLNFFPPSGDASFGFWDASTDGDLLMANALDWAGNQDPDEDGILDDLDNCPEDFNPLQDNIDGDTLGDVCDPCDDRFDPDWDSDSICNSVDVCPDFDDLADGDLDTLPDGCDSCPANPDPTDQDRDGDGTGDVCDICPSPQDPDDSDGDLVCDGVDVCPNHDDHLDVDFDTVLNDCDICPFNANVSQADSDGDELGDACDICPTPQDPIDTDGDQACDGVDQCPGYDDRNDWDDDASPDGCDACPYDLADDSDGDSICDSVDACDGIDDLGENSDYDRFPDACDNCPLIDQERQRDYDEDGFGDECDCRIGDPLAFPGSDERCNYEDDDCDGEVDEDPIDAVEFHPDADGDGQGDKNVVVLGCKEGDGLVSNADDCDDGSPAAFLGGVEACGDGRDNDCDGETDPEALCPVEEDPGGLSDEEFGACLGCNQGASGAGWAVLGLLAFARRRRAAA